MRPAPISTQSSAPRTGGNSFLDSMAAQIAGKGGHKYAPSPTGPGAPTDPHRYSAATSAPGENLPMQSGQVWAHIFVTVCVSGTGGHMLLLGGVHVAFSAESLLHDC